MIERTLGDANCIGIRTSTLDPTASALRNFISFRKAYIASVADKADGNALVNFWKKLEELMQPDFNNAWGLRSRGGERQGACYFWAVFGQRKMV